MFRRHLPLVALLPSSSSSKLPILVICRRTATASSFNNNNTNNINNNTDPHRVIKRCRYELSIMNHVLHPEAIDLPDTFPLHKHDLTHLQFLKTVHKNELWREICAKENVLRKMEFELGLKDTTMEGVLKLKEGAVKSSWKLGANVLGIPLLLYVNYLLYKWLKEFHGWFGGSSEKEEQEKKNKDKKKDNGISSFW